MADNAEVYVGSVSPTITTKQMRELMQVTEATCVLLTEDEFREIVDIYSRAIDRVLKENNIGG